jgi:fructose/tagatose bisphosphate aldolase
MRRLLPTGVATIAIAALLAVTAAGIAVAYFTTTGSGSSSPKTISMLSPPSIVTATPGAGGTVALSWATVPAPGAGNVTYKVERNGADADGTCNTTLTVTSCLDSGLKVGIYTYVVTAKWRSWSVASAGKAATVTIGPVHHFTLSAASLTPTAGATDSLTITAKDAAGSTVTTYAGPHDLVFSGASASPAGTVPTVSDSSGADVAFGNNTTIGFTAGVATVSTTKNGVMRLYKGGATSLTTSDGSISTETPLALTVSAATASKLVLTAAAGTQAAGDANNLTTTAQDTYGNLATSYTGSKSLTFSGASASPGGTTPTVVNSSGTAINFGSATAITFTAGVATVSSSKNGLMRLYASGEPDVNVSDGSISTKTPLEVTVSPLAASKFVLAAATTTPAAGAADNLTTTAQDTYGNVATTYTGTKSLTFSGASASPDGTVPAVTDSTGAEIALGSATTMDFSAGVAAVSASKNGAMKLYKGGSTNLKVTDGTLLTPTALVVTVATTATRLVLAAATTTPTAGASVNLTTTALDVYENTVTTYAGAKNLTFTGASVSPNNTKPTVSNSSGTAVNFGTATPISFTAGVATVSTTKNGVMKLYDAEEASLAVSDGSISSEPLKVTVAPLAASKLVLAAATLTPTAGVADNLTTTAQDTYGNVATSYTGSKSLTFSTASASPDGTVPTVSDSTGAEIAIGSATTIDFNAGVAAVSGAKNGVMKLYKIGSTTIKASDGTFTTANVTLTVATTATKFLLAAATTTPVAAANDNLTITALDNYSNTVTTYTGAKNLVFSGSSASPNGTLPTVINSAGTAINFGSATAINFTSGVASVTSSKNGVMKLNRAGAAGITVSDGTISNPTPLAVTVSPGAAARWALTNINVSAGTLGSTCLFTCTLTGLGNSGTVTAKVAVTDSVGNTVNAVGAGHAAKVVLTGGSGTIGGTPLAIPSTGAAESATTFTYTSKSAGTFTETVTASAAEGTAYTTATLTASK